jgi:alkanesulfonate monooxygenase SsuD/methylene tetrahydromethanopterin reductase-like flavin-dependent oxidoreductase (luciferase family)
MTIDAGQTESALRYPPSTPPETFEHTRESFLRKSGLLLGGFLPNVSWGFTNSFTPSETSPSYEYNRRVATIADHNGLDFVFPVARWKGMGGPSDYWGISLEAFTLAAGLSEATERLGILSTVQCGIVHPLLAAKMGATVDQISGGRWGLNVVAGWNVEESRMFGVPMLEHDQRYDQAAEWLTIVKSLWRTGAVDFEGDYYTLHDGISLPRPRQSPLPPIVNAAASGAGRDLAIRECDLLFVNASGRESAKAQVDAIRERAAELGLPPARVCVVVYGLIHPDPSVVEDLSNRIVAGADWSSIENKVGGLKKGASEVAERTGQRAHLETSREVRPLSAVTGLYTVTGSAETLAEEFAYLHEECGVDGVVLSFFNWATMMEYFCQRGLPHLAAAGLWEPV